MQIEISLGCRFIDLHVSIKQPCIRTTDTVNNVPCDVAALAENTIRVVEWDLVFANYTALAAALLVPNTPSPLSLFPKTPVPPLLLAPNTPLALNTVDKPNTPLPPGTPDGAALVELLLAKKPLLALDAVKAS
jgi:hypothetical protein